MPAARRFSMIRSTDQWRRVLHNGTTIDADSGGIQLRWHVPDPLTTAADSIPERSGLEFDSACRLYHSIPEEDRIDRYAGVVTDLRVRADMPPPSRFLPPPEPPAGEFAPQPPAEEAGRPQALVVDRDDHLFVIEADKQSVAVYDVWNDRFMRRVGFATPGGAPTVPVDLAVHDETVWVLTAPYGLFRMEARSGPVAIAGPPPAAADFEALAMASAPDGLLAIVFGAADGTGRVVFPDSPVPAIAVDGVRDLTFVDEISLVLGRGPGEDLLAYRYLEGAFVRDTPLLAKGYDGRGIVTTPDGRVGFWTATGLRTAVAARVRYERTGQADTYRLDSGRYHQPWGRLFLDACVPNGTKLHVGFATTDEDTEEMPFTPSPTPPDPDLSEDPGTPSQLPTLLEPEARYAVHRRETGREIPWKRLAASDPFEVYETPVHGPAGRFLWVRLHLEGNTRATPQVRSLRAEHHGHDLLRRLPRMFSREETVSDFLQRYLAIFDGVFTEMEGRAVLRHVLVDPQATPEELIPWLSSFIGLIQDERWPVAARRILLAEAAQLFKRRGTIASLSRMLQIYLDLPEDHVIFLEHFRLRGLGGALLAEAAGAATTNSLVGAGLRVGGQIGTPGNRPLTGTTQQAFDRHAHRFSVLLPVDLTSEQRAVIDHILETHRPAHTVVEVCGLDRGLRVGTGLHLAISSMVGRSSGFLPYQLGDSVLGRDAVVGRPDRGPYPAEEPS